MAKYRSTRVVREQRLRVGEEPRLCVANGYESERPLSTGGKGSTRGEELRRRTWRGNSGRAWRGAAAMRGRSRGYVVRKTVVAGGERINNYAW